MISQLKKPNLIEVNNYRSIGVTADTTWSNKDNAKYDDTSNATNIGNAQYSYMMLLSKFNFSIPVNKIIRQIKLHVHGYASANSEISSIYLYKGAKRIDVLSAGPVTLASSEKDHTVLIDNISTVVNYMFDDTFINSDDFKIGFNIHHINNSTVTIDFVEVEILYTDFHQIDKEASTLTEITLTGFSPVISWTNPNNIIDTNDSSYAEVAKAASGDAYSNYIKLVNFGFDIPDNAIITGIQFDIKKQVSLSSGSTTSMWAEDLTVKPVKNNTALEVERGKAGTNYSTNQLTSPPVVHTHGGEQDLWDTTWTPTEINSATFGIQFATKLRGSTTLSKGRIYYVKATVYYTYNGVLRSVTRKAGTVGQFGSDWVNPNNIKDEDDVYTTNTKSGATEVQTDLLSLSNFGFDIPANASIIGFDVRLDGKSSYFSLESSTRFVRPYAIGFFNNIGDLAPDLSGDNSLNIPYRNLSTVETPLHIGSRATEFAKSLVPTDVNASDFQMVFLYSINPNSVSTVLSIDYAEVTLYYTVGTSINYFSKNKKSQIKFGFNGELINMFQGRSSYPDISAKRDTIKYHFFDELSGLADFKLSEGSLQLDVRTDRYIWEMLDQVYKNYFDTLFTFDTNETWSAGTQETTEFRIGDGGLRLSSTNLGNTVATFTRAEVFDHDVYGQLDWVEFFMFVEDPLKFRDINIRISTDTNNYFSITIDKTVLTQGWNHIKRQIKDIQQVGSPTFANITIGYVAYRAETSVTSYIIVDELRVHKNRLYPKRYFDVGLQQIPVAWWSGNTVLYEIKTACEAEGARFYTDEVGDFHFENRQFYNTRPEYKKAAYAFDFDNMTDLEYSGKETDIINKVVVKMKPRYVVSIAEQIWLYGFTTKFDPGEIKEIWASFLDPVPTDSTGIQTPIATTDYTANTAADGSGTDKTTEISIDMSRFSTSAKLTITNNDAGTVYLTFLQLQGTPAKESDETQFIFQDDDSIAKFGESPSGGYVIENKYLADISYAKIIAQQIIDWYKNPVKKILLKNRAVPQLQIGDLISVYNKDVLAYYIMRIIKLKYYFSKTGFNQDILTREVGKFETLTYFTIGVSAIEGPDVIST